MAYPDPVQDEGELFVRWLDFLRRSLISKLDGLGEEQARWHPDGKLLSVLGVVNHLTCVEWRWIDGAFIGLETSRSEEEFRPAPTIAVDDILTAYRVRGAETTRVIRGAALLTKPCVHPMAKGRDLRWVLLHLVEETARHAGHADATRELLDGATGL
ncbi:MAG: DinB family protein [Actinomycetota bacterium]|nr:DinB family protein [Actinomycetota bacterium]